MYSEGGVLDRVVRGMAGERSTSVRSHTEMGARRVVKGPSCWKPGERERPRAALDLETEEEGSERWRGDVLWAMLSAFAALRGATPSLVLPVRGCTYVLLLSA